MIAPPRRIEALLHALGVDAPYRDAILGDLAEEFAIRVEEQSVDEARRWYRRQAARTAPHLLRQWARRLSGFDVAQIIAFTFIYLFVNMLVRLGIQTGVVLWFGVRPDHVYVIGYAWHDLVIAGAPEVTLGYLAAAAGSVFVGYVLSRLEPRAPLATAIVVGLGIGVVTGTGLASNSALPLWLRLSLPPLFAAGTIAGAALRVLRTSEVRRTTVLR
jgi:hypothetical protein